MAFFCFCFFFFILYFQVLWVVQSMYIATTIYIVVVDLIFESTMLNLFFGALVFHLLFVGLIKFFCFARIQFLHFDWIFLL